MLFKEVLVRWRTGLDWTEYMIWLFYINVHSKERILKSVAKEALSLDN